MVYVVSKDFMTKHIVILGGRKMHGTVDESKGEVGETH